MHLVGFVIRDFVPKKDYYYYYYYFGRMICANVCRRTPGYQGGSLIRITQLP